MILWIVYFVMAGVILYLVIKVLKLSDEVETLDKSKQYWIDRFLKEQSENEKNKDIIENIKNSMPF